MNAQNVKEQGRRPQVPLTPPAQRRKRPDPKLLTVMRGAMLVLGALILAVGLLLIVLPMFRVKTVEIVGAGTESNRQMILQSAGIGEGTEILSLDSAAIIERIQKECPFVDPAEISITVYPSKVRITVVEYPNPMYTEANGKFYTLNQQLLVLEEYQSAESLGTYLPVILPEILHAEAGKTLAFANGDVEMSYIKSLVDALEADGTLSRVSAVDCSQKYSVSYILDGSVRVELGRVADMAAKLRLCKEILTEKGSGIAYAIVNVSDLQTPVFRTVSAEEVFRGYPEGMRAANA